MAGKYVLVAGVESATVHVMSTVSRYFICLLEEADCLQFVFSGLECFHLCDFLLELAFT